VSVPKHRLLGGSYHRGLIVNLQMYRPSDGNQKVDIKCSAHDTFLEWPSTGTFEVERVENK